MTESMSVNMGSSQAGQDAPGQNPEDGGTCQFVSLISANNKEEGYKLTVVQ